MLRRSFCLLALGTLLPGSLVRAANNSATITIRVTSMHCANCARKIAGRLFTVPGVVGVKTNLSTDTAYITASNQKTPDAKALWEAVEKAGFQPTELVHPAGTFTQKPA